MFRILIFKFLFDLVNTPDLNQKVEVIFLCMLTLRVCVCIIASVRQIQVFSVKILLFRAIWENQGKKERQA